MFQRLENIFNAIKGFFGFFGSVVQFFVNGFMLMATAIRFVMDIYNDNYNHFVLPRYVGTAATIVLMVWAIRTITGRLNK